MYHPYGFIIIHWKILVLHYNLLACSITFLYFRTISGTSVSCGIVAGAAALILEKFPHYTPQQVKEYLIDQSTPGVVQTSSRKYRVRPNRFLYVGQEGMSYIIPITQFTLCLLHFGRGWWQWWSGIDSCLIDLEIS